MNSSGNHSQVAQIKGSSFNLPFHSSLILMSVAIVSVNIFVIYLFNGWIAKRLASTWLLVNLALADIVTGAVVIPLVILSSARVVSDRPSQQILAVSASTINMFSAFISIFGLSAISYDRYMLVCQPMHYRRLVNMRKIKALIMTLWITAFVLALLPFTWSHRIFRHKLSIVQINRIHKIDSIYSLMCTILFFFLPLSFMAFALFHMLATVRKAQRASKERNNGKEKKCTITESAVAALFGCMFFMFVLSWTPLMTIRLLVDLRFEFTSLPEIVPQLFVALRCLMSICNPLVYSLRTIGFRDAFLRFAASKGGAIVCKRRSQSHQTCLTMVESENCTCSRKRRGVSVLDWTHWTYYVDHETKSVAV